MSKVALSYDIPFVDTMIMPAGWARWLASQRSSPNKAIRDAEKVSETTTWRYEDHGLLPCMQFFYDWRFADLTGDGLDEVFVNGPHEIHILDGDGTLLETIPGHLIYVFDLVGDRRAEAVTLVGIEPGMKLQIVTDDQPSLNPDTNPEIAYRVTTPAMFNVTRY